MINIILKEKEKKTKLEVIIIKKQFIDIFQFAKLLKHNVEFVANILFDNDFNINLYSLINIYDIIPYFSHRYKFNKNLLEEKKDIDFDINNNIENIRKNINLFTIKNKKKNNQNNLNKYNNNSQFKSIICSIIGFVDNGKTTFLKKIISSKNISLLYKTNIEREENGMSQKNTGYVLRIFEKKEFLLIDTPGHQLFKFNR